MKLLEHELSKHLSLVTINVNDKRYQGSLSFRLFIFQSEFQFFLPKLASIVH